MKSISLEITVSAIKIPIPHITVWITITIHINRFFRIQTVEIQIGKVAVEMQKNDESERLFQLK